jgi:hypothetical protein
MTQEHPITPPPELVEDWIEIAKPLPQRSPDPNELAILAARWGADQELEACVEWLVANDWKAVHKHLRTARRPKPPSLKEPTDKELAELYRKSYYECENRQGDAAQVFALRAVLAHWGQ